MISDDEATAGLSIIIKRPPHSSRLTIFVVNNQLSVIHRQCWRPTHQLHFYGDDSICMYVCWRCMCSLAKCFFGFFQQNNILIHINSNAVIDHLISCLVLRRMLNIYTDICVNLNRRRLSFGGQCIISCGPTEVCVLLRHENAMWCEYIRRPSGTLKLLVT